MLLARDMHDDPGQARQLLLAAREHYDRLAMAPWIDRASELLAAVQTADPTIC